MPELVLNARPRKVVGKQVKALRRSGLLPAVLYGAGVEPTSLELDGREASRLLARTTGATLIDLKVDGQTHKVLVREIQRHAVRRDIQHVDFLKVAMDQTIRAQVPVELVGEAPAVKTLGGVLVTILNEIEVEALPGDLPDRISADLERLAKIDDSITVRDLVVGEGVRVLTSPDEVIVHVIYEAAEVVEEVVEAAPAEIEPEVISRAKREEAEGEGEEEKPSE
jgi:large subunit ribosomal protein L25